MHEDRAARGFAALGNPSRLRIFRLLVQAGTQGVPIGYVHEHLGIPLSTLAHHLSVLSKAGLITQEKAGREVLCRAGYAEMNALIAYLTDKCCAGLPPEAPPAKPSARTHRPERVDS